MGLAAIKAAATFTPDAMGGKILRREFARKLVAMRGVPMKIAQAISMSKDGAMAALQKEALRNVPGVPAEAVLSRLRAAAPELVSAIVEFSNHGIAASLGQVHKVRMRDGRVCALKMKHPGIRPAMDLDAGLMELLVSIFGHFREGFAIGAFQELLTQELRWELDYPYEISRQGKLWRLFEAFPRIVVPKPFPEESGEEFLLMDWEESAAVEAFAATASVEERREAVDLISEFHLRSLLAGGMVHADPNPGNFGLRRGAVGVELVVYDFGSLIPLPESLAIGFPRLIETIRSGRNPLPDLHGMGFLQAPLSAIEPKIQELFEILLEPFLIKGGFKPAEWDRRRRVIDLLGPERWNLMVSAPPSMLFLMRAMHGLFHYAEVLGGEMHLEEIFGALSEGKAPPASLFAATPHGGAGKPGSAARNLRVTVAKNGIRVVSITLPADAVDRLEQIMDPDLLMVLRSRGIEVSDASEAARRNGYMPMQVFAWEDGEKNVDIRLE